METLQRFLVYMFVCLFLSGCSDAFISILVNLGWNCCLLLHCLLSVMFLILSSSSHCEKEPNKKIIFPVLFPYFESPYWGTWGVWISSLNVWKSSVAMPKGRTAWFWNTAFVPFLPVWFKKSQASLLCQTWNWADTFVGGQPCHR